MNALFEGEGLQFQNIIRYPNFQISPQTVTFLTGPSGTGKSTLMRMFNGTITPSAGTLRYFGKPIADYSPLVLRREALLFSQEIFLFSGTIQENFKYFYQYRGLSEPDDKQMRRWLSLCALSMPPEASCNLLSGGERQRVMLAIYLSFSPSVFLLDEPTSALDIQTANELFDHLVAYAKKVGMTLIIVSHTEELVKKFAQECIMLKREEGLWERNG